MSDVLERFDETASRFDRHLTKLLDLLKNAANLIAEARSEYEARIAILEAENAALRQAVLTRRKLDGAAVVDIIADPRPQEEIAVEYGVHQSTISRIKALAALAGPEGGT